MRSARKKRSLLIIKSSIFLYIYKIIYSEGIWEDFLNLKDIQMKTYLITYLLLFFSFYSYSQTQDWKVYNTETSAIPSNFVNDMCYDEAADAFWLATIGEGLVHWDKGDKWTAYNTQNSKIPNDSIFYVMQTKDQQNMWVATFGGGLVHIDSKKNMQVYDRENSDLPSNFVTRIVEDNQGNLWITTLEFMSVMVDNVENGGIVKIDKTGNWTVFNKENSPLPTNNVFSLAVDQNDHVWVGTINAASPTEILEDGAGLVRIPPEGEWEIYNTENSLIPSNNIMDIIIDDSNSLWFGDLHGNLTLFCPYETNPVYDFMQHFLDGQDGWLTLKNELLFNNQILCLATNREQNAIYLGVGPPDLLCFPIINPTAPPPSGIFYFTPQMDQGNFSTEDHPIADFPVNDIFVDMNNQAWIATQGGGIAHSVNSTSSPTFDSTTISLHIYPNPVQEQLQMEVTLPAHQLVEVRLYDIQGRVCVQQSWQHLQSGVQPLSVPLSTDVHAGSYVLELLIDGEQVKVEKLVKE